MIVGSGNTYHLSKEQLIEQIQSDYSKIRKKPTWLIRLYVKLNAGNLSWKEIRHLASMCRGQLQVEKFGKVL